MNRSTILGLVIGAAVFAAPAFVLADSPAQVVVTLQTAGGSAMPQQQATVMVDASGASISGYAQNGNSVSYGANFDGSSRTVSFWPGSYDISVSTIPNYTYSYSSGCNGAISGSGTAYCTVTARQFGNGYNNYSGNPYCYNGYNNYGGNYYYNYNNCYGYQGALTCSPNYQQGALGATVVFNATGGNGSYLWTSGSYAYSGNGSVLNAQFYSPGPQTVSVASGGQTAYCTVNIVGNNYYPLTYTAQPYPPAYPPAPYAPQYRYPSLPNTGFGPIAWWQYALAAALLALFGALAIYVRNQSSYRSR